MAFRRGAAPYGLRALLRRCTSCSLFAPAGSSSTTSSRSVLAGQRLFVLDEEPCDFSSTSVRRTLCHQPAFGSSRSLSSSSADATARVVIVENDAQYERIMKDVKNKETLGVVYYTAQWCGPCKQIAPYVDQLSQQFDDVTFLKVDIDKLEVEETMRSSHIAVVPTFHFHKKGELVAELTGAVRDKLEDLVKSLRSTS